MKEYFSHDYFAKEDEKIKNLLFRHSWEGYGIYWGLIESLYQNDGYMQLDYERIAFDMRTQKEIIDSVINTFDLFKIKGNLFYSESVLRRLKKRKEKSKTARKSAEFRWGKRISYNAEDNANALKDEYESNAIKENKKKGKENKINKNNNEFDFKKSLLDLGIEEKKIMDWLKVRKTKRLTNSETAFNAIKKQIELRKDLTPSDCIELAVIKSWGGFEADWIKPEDLKLLNKQQFIPPNTSLDNFSWEDRRNIK